MSDRSPINPTSSRHDKGLNGRLTLAIAAAAFGSSFQHGYNTGVVNAPQKLAEEFINETSYDRNQEYMDEAGVTFIWSWIVSIFCIGGIIGGLMTSVVADKIGRKSGLMWNNVFVLVAVVLQGFAKTAGSYEMLIAGRFFIGLNSGLNAGLAPMYLCEISPVNLRGAIGSVYQLVVTISILMSQILGLSSLLGTETRWPWLFVVTAFPAVFQLVTLPMCPESPKFTLLNKGQELEAKRALEWLRDTPDVDDEMEEMRAEYQAMRAVPQVTLGEMFTSGALRMPLFISCVVMLAQQLSGINAVMYFSTEIFKSAGLSGQTAILATMAMGATNVLMTVMSVILVEKAGRKTLLLIGFTGMFIDVILLYLCIRFQETAAWIPYMSIILVIGFVVMFATGPGSIPWFYVTELFQQGARPMATAIAVGVNWTANFLVGFYFLQLKNAMGANVFFIFAGLLIVFIVFIGFKVPETKGKTAEEITAQFRQESYGR